jgi:hypothetical protein
MNPAINLAMTSAMTSATNAVPSGALASLRDIHLPDAVGIWPLAPGWWVLLALISSLSVGAHLVIRARRRSLKRAAMRELDAIAVSFREGQDASEPALRLAVLLRRVAIARFPQREVAGLHGSDWAAFLLRTSGKRGGITEEMVRGLAAAVYAGPRATPSQPQIGAWVTGARHWIGGNG